MSILLTETIKSWFLKSTIFTHTFKDTWAFENKTLSWLYVFIAKGCKAKNSRRYLVWSTELIWSKDHTYLISSFQCISKELKQTTPLLATVLIPTSLVKEQKTNPSICSLNSFKFELSLMKLQVKYGMKHEQSNWAVQVSGNSWK